MLIPLRIRQVSIVIAGIVGVLGLIAPAAWGDQIILKSGETIKGKIVETNDDSVTIEHELFGTTTIPTEKIQSLSVDEPEKDPEIAEAVEELDKEIQDSAFISFLKEWNTNFEIGFNTSSGDTESAFFMTALNMKKETEKAVDRFNFLYVYELKDEGDGDDRNESTTTYRRDWLTESKWLYYLLLRAETDAFKSWDWRFSGNGGLGYRFLRISDDDPIDLTGRFGLGGNQEIGSDDEDFNPEAAINGELLWHHEDWSTVGASLTYLPSLERLDDYRILATLDWTLKINDTLSIRFGIDEEYESIVDPGDSNNNLKTYGSLVIAFK